LPAYVAGLLEVRNKTNALVCFQVE